MVSWLHSMFAAAAVVVVAAAVVVAVVDFVVVAAVLAAAVVVAAGVHFEAESLERGCLPMTNLFPEICSVFVVSPASSPHQLSPMATVICNRNSKQ